MKITGYAATFYRHGDPRTEYEVSPGVFERIDKRAFDATLKKQPVVSLFNHDSNVVLGRNSVAAGTLTLTVDGVGLKYIVDLPDSPNGKNVAEAIRRRDVVGSSFMFVPTRQRFEDTTRNGKPAVLRIIEELVLYECGPVCFAAYESTTAGVA